jgi:hypothetical protein
MSAPPIYIPEKLAKGLEGRGLSVVDIIASALDLDPETVIEARLELAEEYLREVEDYVEKGDAVQTSEKSYKA